MYADDHPFYDINKNVSTIQTKLQDCALKVTTWSYMYHNITLLGVNIDRALNVSDHISNICKKATQPG